MLTSYSTDTLDLLHDPNNSSWTATQITDYINRARNRIAGRGQCVRILLSGGTITAIAIATAGSGLPNGTLPVVFTGAGQQAFATATISGNICTAVTLNQGGWGYITGTTTTAATASATGTNATFTLTIDNSLTTNPAQEKYTFATANVLAQSQTQVAGVNEIIGVLSVSCAWGANAAMKPTLDQMIWSEFQAYYRSYNMGLQNYPTIWSQYGTGVIGSIYLWPQPSTPSQMDWDTYCLPIALVNDTTAEAIPYPWTACVPYYAAYLAYFNAQRDADADKMLAEYERKIEEATVMSTPAFVTNYYRDDVSA